MDTDKRQALLAGTAARPSAIRIEMVQSGATATATLLWDQVSLPPFSTGLNQWSQAPGTCAAIVASLPFSTVCWHGRNSGAEALCLTPTVISDLPQVTHHCLQRCLLTVPAGRK